uniref:PIH1 N-terminal domain-containing protein n=8 Tax=Passeriformes TaxID=9126 RepID=A0A8C5TQS4_9PASS
MADPSLLSAELETDEAEEEAALRRLLLVRGVPADPTPLPCPVSPPRPGLCVKTRAGGDKVFVNVCHSPEVPPWTEVRDPLEIVPKSLLPRAPSVTAKFSSNGLNFAGGRGCTAYDVVVNSGFFRTLQADPLYLEFFLTVAMEGLSEKYGVELELTGWRVLRNRKFLGSISAQNIRARPRPHIQELPGGLGLLWVCPSSDPALLGPTQEGAGSLWLGLSEERLLLVRPPPEALPPSGAVSARGRCGRAAGAGAALPPDPARCRARFHRRSKVTMATAGTRPLRPWDTPPERFAPPTGSHRDDAAACVRDEGRPHGTPESFQCWSGPSPGSSRTLPDPPPQDHPGLLFGDPFQHPLTSLGSFSGLT